AVATNGVYRVSVASDYVLLADTNAGQLDVSDGKMNLVLPRAAGGPAMFGPLFLSSGLHKLVSHASVRLGPVMAWTSLSRSVLKGLTPSVIINTDNASSESLGIRIVTGHPWIEVRSTYDPDWRSSIRTYHTVGDGLFNLFLAAPSTSQLSLQFGTQQWESLGRGVTLGTLAFVA